MRVSVGPTAVTYRYNENITAPTEEPEYRDGMSVNITLITADGTQLLNTQTTTFPVATNYSGIKSSMGTIQFRFTVTTEATTTTDPNTGETVQIEGTTMEKKVTRDVVFTAEGC